MLTLTLLAVSLTTIIVSSLVVADRIDKRHLPKPRLSKEAVAEKRRILERHRSGLFTTITPDGRQLATGGNEERLQEIDRELLALAEQERE